MVPIIVLCALANLFITHGQAVFSSTGLPCDKHHDCLVKKCEFDIVPTCVYGKCICDMDTARDNQFVYELQSNIEKYLATHYTKTVLRNKRSMTHDPRNRLSKKIADGITFDESRINKRSIRNMMPQNLEMLYPLRNCAENITSEQNRLVWMSVANSLRLQPAMEEREFFTNWNDVIKPFSKDTLTSEEFSQNFPQLSVNEVVSGISSTNTFQRLFWPFIYEFAFMNQKLALLGLTREVVPSQVQKSTFFAALEKIQGIRIPIVERKVTYSFDKTDLVDGLIHHDAVSGSNVANNSQKRMFNTNERNEIITKTDAALELINETMPGLYKAINQMIGCIGFYKSEDRAHISGSMNSAMGMIWFDPSSTANWSIPFYAENIVHEYIHTSLYMAEMVHGMFADHQKLSLTKIMSSIRLEKRDYDKSFHACYVSTGLVAFHAKAGFWTRVRLLAETINATIQELTAANDVSNILSPAGEATLQAMKQFTTVIRLN